jgi:DNA ligase-associated metallophosphoesterase
MQNNFDNSAESIQCCDETLLLHPQKVMYWPARKTLFAADIHAGKEQVFTRSGIAIPGGITENTLTRLMQLTDSSGAERLIILGDFVHAVPRSSEAWQTHLKALLKARTQLDLQVVIGNHDSASARKATLAELNWQSQISDPPFIYKHEPDPEPHGYVLAGHIHPVWQLGHGRRNRVRSPVYWFQQQVGVLPSFGIFTGGQLIQREKSDRIYMVGSNSVIAV